MNSSSAAPLPSLPLEVKGHVLRFCDPSTLAVTSRVSLAFLELSIPILHDNITIRGLENMEKLLCSRAGSPPSALDSILSLRRVRAFTLVCMDEDGPLPAASFDRLASGWSLPVDHLTLELFRRVHDHWDAYDADDSPDPRWNSLLPLFEPESVLILAPPRESGVAYRPAWIKLVSAPWHRLGMLEFNGATCIDALGELDLVHRLASEDTIVPLTVIYTISEEDYLAGDDSMIGSMTSDLAYERHTEDRDLLDPTSRVSEVIVRVPSQKAKEDILKELEPRLEGLHGQELERELKLIRVEMTGPAGPTNATAT